MTSIKTKLIILVLLIAIVPLTLLGVLSFYKTTDIFTKSIQDSLLTLVKSKENSLENYLDITESAGLGLATTDAIQNYITYKVDENYSDDEHLERLSMIRKQVENLLYSFQEAHWGKYHHIFLIDRSQRIVISPNHGLKQKGSPSSHINVDTSGNNWARIALSLGVTKVSDYSSWIESDHIHQMLFYPVKDINGVTHAVIGFELQIPYEQDILSKDLDMGKSGRMFLATTSGNPILYKGMENEEPVSSFAIQEAQNTGFSSGRRLNTNGVEVIDVYLKNAIYPWILVAEVESAEAFRNINKLQIYAIFGFVTTIVVALILAILFSNYIVNPMKKLTKQMELISLGKFNIDIDETDRKDEIGSMVLAFERMALSFKIIMGRYEKLKAEKK